MVSQRKELLQRGLAVQISRRGRAVADLRSVAGGVVGENFSGDTQTGQGREMLKGCRMDPALSSSHQNRIDAHLTCFRSEYRRACRRLDFTSLFTSLAIEAYIN